MILPVFLLLIASTHSSGALNIDGLQITPGGDALQNYSDVISLKAGFTDQISAFAMLRNSLIVATGLASLTTVFSLCAAYALVYFRLPLAGFMFWLTMATLLLPLESRFVTTFQVAATLGLVNTQLGMILPALALALGTLFFRQLLLSFPNEYLEAAKLDGAGPVMFFRDFILPLARRRGGAIFVVSFMIGWHQYLWPLMLSTDETTYTVVRGIRLIGLESGPGMALAVLTLLPPLILIIIFQRYFFHALADSKDSF
ncbi:ABC transporter permease subunit [Roseobacter denitrificans]|nr:ABC transporter permease subunit [Roseobacter denitrificans]SFF82053.1 carbohydrate ABC transporter membrane protein 2, CUT1 family [Roseobacter denitrificans OCh 114]